MNSEVEERTVSRSIDNSITGRGQYIYLSQVSTKGTRKVGWIREDCIVHRPLELQPASSGRDAPRGLPAFMLEIPEGLRFGGGAA